VHTSRCKVVNQAIIFVDPSHEELAEVPFIHKYTYELGCDVSYDRLIESGDQLDS
jgi:hypothetical protein